MGRKTKKQKAHELYEEFEKEWLKTHDEDRVDLDYAIQVAIHVSLVCDCLLDITKTSDYYVASILANALYSYNDETSFYKSYKEELYHVLPKEKVDKYIYGRFDDFADGQALNVKYNELEFVEKYKFDLGRPKSISV